MFESILFFLVLSIAVAPLFTVQYSSCLSKTRLPKKHRLLWLVSSAGVFTTTPVLLVWLRVVIEVSLCGMSILILSQYSCRTQKCFITKKNWWTALSTLWDGRWLMIYLFAMDATFSLFSGFVLLLLHVCSLTLLNSCRVSLLSLIYKILALTCNVHGIITSGQDVFIHPESVCWSVCQQDYTKKKKTGKLLLIDFH